MRVAHRSFKSGCPERAGVAEDWQLSKRPYAPPRRRCDGRPRPLGVGGNLGCIGMREWPFQAADPDISRRRAQNRPRPLPRGSPSRWSKQAAEQTRSLLVELAISGNPEDDRSKGHADVQLPPVPAFDSTTVRAAAALRSLANSSDET